MFFLFFVFFFQAEDGIRDHCVTGVQTCALPISSKSRGLMIRRAGSRPLRMSCSRSPRRTFAASLPAAPGPTRSRMMRSEERRVGKECRSRGARDRYKKKKKKKPHNGTHAESLNK